MPVIVWDNNDNLVIASKEAHASKLAAAVRVLDGKLSLFAEVGIGPFSESAEKTFFSGRVYFLINMQYSYPSGPADPDRPGLDATIRQVVEVVFSGSLAADPAPAGESLEASFTGTFDGKPVQGRLRGTQYDHDMLIVAVTSGSASDLQDPGVTDYLTNVAVQHDPK